MTGTAGKECGRYSGLVHALPGLLATEETTTRTNCTKMICSSDRSAIEAGDCSPSNGNRGGQNVPDENELESSGSSEHCRRLCFAKYVSAWGRGGTEPRALLSGLAQGSGC
jgi:hypothetical protein